MDDHCYRNRSIEITVTLKPIVYLVPFQVLIKLIEVNLSLFSGNDFINMNADEALFLKKKKCKVHSSKCNFRGFLKVLQEIIVLFIHIQAKVILTKFERLRKNEKFLSHLKSQSELSGLF